MHNITFTVLTIFKCTIQYYQVHSRCGTNNLQNTFHFAKLYILKQQIPITPPSNHPTPGNYLPFKLLNDTCVLSLFVFLLFGEVTRPE